MLQYLKQAGAKAVAFDMLFTESSDAADPTDDAQFSSAISNGSPFVVALSLSETQGLTTNWPAYLPPAPALRMIDGAGDLSDDRRIRQTIQHRREIQLFEKSLRAHINPVHTEFARRK